MNNYIELGNISGFFGVRGWVKIFSFSRPRIGIANYSDFYLGDDKKPIVFTKIKENGKNIVAHIKNIDSRELAANYIGQKLFIQKSELPKLENEYYWHEIIGLKVINQQDVVLGIVTEMMETGANDVMVVNDGANVETLIPYVFSHFIIDIDMGIGEMRVNWELDDEMQ